ncbi:hypothetical protein C7271_06310 [filamentous cyanobacterium CCP5]|nr:hypothetical protein C7271_06310 [filamentous cyanobacterium CCP5]
MVPVSAESDPTYRTVTLASGRYEAVNGPFSVELVNQEDWIAFGDLTDDGQDDAVVVLGVNCWAITG